MGPGLFRAGEGASHLEGETMLTVRSTSLALAAALALLSSACVSHEGQRARTSEVKADTDFARVHSARPVALAEPEYVEGVTPPPTPMAVMEQPTRAPSTAHVWVAGHHARRDGQWVWVRGRHELPPRDGLVWVPGHWVDHMNGYVWIEGGWR
jgi:hypothetical protein